MYFYKRYEFLLLFHEKSENISLICHILLKWLFQVHFG